MPLDAKDVVRMMLRESAQAVADYGAARMQYDANANQQNQTLLQNQQARLAGVTNKTRLLADELRSKRAFTLKQEESAAKREKDEELTALIQGSEFLSPEEKEMLLIQQGDLDVSKIREKKSANVYDQFYSRLDEMYPPDDPNSAERRKKLGAAFMDKMAGMRSDNPGALQQLINAIEKHVDDPEEQARLITKALGGPEEPSKTTELQEEWAEIQAVKKIDSELGSLLEAGFRQRLTQETGQTTGQRTEEWINSMEADGTITPERAAELRKSNRDKAAGIGTGKAGDSDLSPSEAIAAEDLWYAEGRLPPDQVKEIIAFRKDIQNSQNFQALVKAKRALNVMADATEGDSPVSEIAVLYTFIRAIDPGSVVREGELAIFTAARGAMARVGELRDKVQEGTALTEDEVKEIGKIANSMIDTYKEDYDAMEETVKAGLEAHGAYMRTDKDGNVIAMTDPKTFMQMASFEGVNIDTTETEAEPPPSTKRLNVDAAVKGEKAKGKTLEQVIGDVKRNYPDQLDEFIEAWMGDNSDGDE